MSGHIVNADSDGYLIVPHAEGLNVSPVTEGYTVLPVIDGGLSIGEKGIEGGYDVYWMWGDGEWILWGDNEEISQ